jgi:hypothetical protein
MYQMLSCDKYDKTITESEQFISLIVTSNFLGSMEQLRPLADTARMQSNVFEA